MTIGPAEYLARISRLAALARGAGLDGIVLSHERNIYYFSGYLHHNPIANAARPMFAVISADGRAVLVMHAFLLSAVEASAAVVDLRAYARSGGAPVELLAETLKGLGLQRGRLGAELGYEQRLGMSWEDFAALQRSLPEAAFVDCSALLWRLRMKKSRAEIELIRRACDITTLAYEACFGAVREGMTEREACRIAAEAAIHHGADRTGFIVASSGRENYQRLGGQPSDRPLRRGDMLWIDMGMVYRGYWSDFSRAAVVGRPTAEQVRMQQAILEVNRACLAAVQVGEPVKRIPAAAEAAFAALGLEVKVGQGRIGHGMGLMTTEPPHVAHYEETPMEEGLVLAIEPRVLTDYGIFHAEENVVVTAAGVESLRAAPRELAVAGD